MIKCISYDEMKIYSVSDMLEIIPEWYNVIVFNLDWIELASYDGKNSIPMEYNSLSVYEMYYESNTETYYIVIDEYRKEV